MPGTKRTFGEFLSDDVLVEVLFKNEKPYCVQKSLIASASETLASKIKTRDVKNSPNGLTHYLRLNHGTSDAVEVLMYYIAKGRLPEMASIEAMQTDTFEVLVEFWLLGYKLHGLDDNFDGFDGVIDTVMLELIKRSEAGESSWNLVKHVFQAEPLSALTALLAEEVVIDLEIRHSRDWSELRLFQDTPRFFEGLGYAMAEFKERGGRAWKRFEENDKWTLYLVGDGPTKPWALE